MEKDLAENKCVECKKRMQEQDFANAEYLECGHFGHRQCIIDHFKSNADEGVEFECPAADCGIKFSAKYVNELTKANVPK